VQAVGRQLVIVEQQADARSVTTDARNGLAQDTLRQFGVLHARACGGSMLPAIAPGDRLTFRACAAADARPGQVVLVRYLGQLVSHRLVRQDGAQVLTHGDALSAPDLPIDAGDVLAVLVSQQRREQALHAGGRHWLRRQRAARWLIRRVDLVQRLFARLPHLASLTA